jgi:hypothetical protein
LPCVSCCVMVFPVKCGTHFDWLLVHRSLGAQQRAQNEHQLRHAHTRADLHRLPCHVCVAYGPLGKARVAYGPSGKARQSLHPGKPPRWTGSCLHVDSDASHALPDEMEWDLLSQQPKSKGLLVSFAHEVRHQLLVQLCLDVEECCQHQAIPRPAASVTRAHRQIRPHIASLLAE